MIKPYTYSFTALAVKLTGWHITLRGYEWQEDRNRYYFFFCLVPCKNRNIYNYGRQYRIYKRLRQDDVV